jgi:cytochrome bd-type quinol oxidase subunit 1
MIDLLAARLQMAISLAFHIIFAVVGIGMPVLADGSVRHASSTDEPRRPS